MGWGIYFSGDHNSHNDNYGGITCRSLGAVLVEGKQSPVSIVEGDDLIVSAIFWGRREAP